LRSKVARIVSSIASGARSGDTRAMAPSIAVLTRLRSSTAMREASMTPSVPLSRPSRFRSCSESPALLTTTAPRPLQPAMTPGSLLRASWKMATTWGRSMGLLVRSWRSAPLRRT